VLVDPDSSALTMAVGALLGSLKGVLLSTFVGFRLGAVEPTLSLYKTWKIPKNWLRSSTI
jgi:hypothetical protein